MRQWMQKSLFQTADVGLSLTVSWCRRLSIGQWMQYSLYQDSIYQTADARLYDTADAGISLSDSGWRRNSSKQRMQEFLYETADAGDTLSR